jgi:hypothetical protein
LLSDSDYAEIEAAVMETARGRWFLAEYARRNRQADTRMLLDALARLEQVVREERAALAVATVGAAVAAEIAPQPVPPSCDAEAEPALEKSATITSPPLAAAASGEHVLPEARAASQNLIGNSERKLACSSTPSPSLPLSGGGGRPAQAAHSCPRVRPFEAPGVSSGPLPLKGGGIGRGSPGPFAPEAIVATLEPSESVPVEITSAAEPRSGLGSMAHAIVTRGDPLAAVTALSYEEKIALFT